MASTYSNTGIELIADGEQSGTWGQTTNLNWQIIEELASGIVSVALSATTYTLTTTDGASSEGRHAVIKFTGSPGGACTVTISPNDMQKVYWVVNGSDQSVILSQGSGANVTILSGNTTAVYCDGAGAGAAVTELSAGIDLDTIVSKTSTTGSAILPSGTTAERDGSPAAGYLRWNSTEGSAEVYDGSDWGSVGGGGAAETVYVEHAHTLAANSEIASGNNAVSSGPITISTGYSVTVPSGSIWTIV